MRSQEGIDDEILRAMSNKKVRREVRTETASNRRALCRVLTRAEREITLPTDWLPRGYHQEDRVTTRERKIAEQAVATIARIVACASGQPSA